MARSDLAVLQSGGALFRPTQKHHNPAYSWGPKRYLYYWAPPRFRNVPGKRLPKKSPQLLSSFLAGLNSNRISANPFRLVGGLLDEGLGLVLSLRKEFLSGDLGRLRPTCTFLHAVSQLHSLREPGCTFAVQHAQHRRRRRSLCMHPWCWRLLNGESARWVLNRCPP